MSLKARSMDRHREKLEISCGIYCGPFFNLSAASGLSTPPTTPTQSSSQPVFTQEAQPIRRSPERLELSSRSRSLSTPPDTGQRLSLPSAKPPIPSSSPVPSYSTSQQVSHASKMLLILRRHLKLNANYLKTSCNLFSSGQLGHCLRFRCNFFRQSAVLEHKHTFGVQTWHLKAPRSL